MNVLVQTRLLPVFLFSKIVQSVLLRRFYLNVKEKPKTVLAINFFMLFCSFIFLLYDIVIEIFRGSRDAGHK